MVVKKYDGVKGEPPFIDAGEGDIEREKKTRCAWKCVSKEAFSSNNNFSLVEILEAQGICIGFGKVVERKHAQLDAFFTDMSGEARLARRVFFGIIRNCIQLGTFSLHHVRKSAYNWMHFLSSICPKHMKMPYTQESRVSFWALIEHSSSIHCYSMKTCF